MESASSSWLASPNPSSGKHSHRQQVYSTVHSPNTSTIYSPFDGANAAFVYFFGSSSGYYPSIIGFIATIVVFLVIIYLQGVRIELPMSYAGYKGFRSRYPIKLLYVSNLPVIFASALFANVYFFTQLLWSQLGKPDPGTNLLFQIIGDYNTTTSIDPTTGQSSTAFTPSAA